MQKIIFLFFSLIGGIGVFGQQQYFVYIQADELQPFYAKISNKIYSSSEKGYLIIPRLEDKTYEITIGFAKDQMPEQRFSVDVSGKDQGFQLKKFGDKGWGLFNLQTMAVSMHTGDEGKPAEELQGAKKTDAFSELLANVVNDSAILYSSARPKPAEAARKDTLTVKRNDTQAPDTISGVAPDRPAAAVAQPPDKQDSALVTRKPEETKEAIKKDSVSVLPGQSAETADKDAKDPQSKPKPIPEKPFILKIKEESAAGLYTAVYLEQYNFSTDTIRISIPLGELPPVSAPVAENKPEQKLVPAKADTAMSVATNTVVPKTTPILILNSDCKKIANEYDVDKLRVKLMDNKTVDDKINTAKKYFKSKCLTVKQIMALSELFPTEETKLRFLDSAYPFVSDTGNFILLEELFVNEFYKTRFKAMIHQ